MIPMLPTNQTCSKSLSSSGQTMSKIRDALEIRLQDTLSKIENANKWSSIEHFHLFLDSFYAEAKRKPWTNLTKTCIAFIGLSAIYPAIIGSWACIETLFVIPLSDMESKDLETAMPAAQGIGNAGMGVTYITQLEEFVFHPIYLAFVTPYNKKLCTKLKNSYREILPDDLSIEEKNFLIDRINQKLSLYRGISNFIFENDIQTQIDLIQNQIDNEIVQRLSTKNLIHLVAKQTKEDIKNSTWTEIAKKTTKTIVTIGLVGVSSCILAIGTYGCYKPFDLQNPNELASSDQTEVDNAIANYANTGHGLEYIAVGGILIYKGGKSIIGNQYKTVMYNEIQNIYSHYIKNQSKEISDLLHKQMGKILIPYQH